jgi:hypothetical protein
MKKGFDDLNNPLIKDMYKRIRKRPCDCGYDPDSKKKSSTTEHHCPVTKALCNHITFPAVKLVPDVDDSSKIYYNQEDGSPLQHWCLLIELHEMKHPRFIVLFFSLKNIIYIKK